jgi:ketosteroid isomerase-like protein
VLVIALLAGCGGGGPKTDAGAVKQVIEDAAKAVAAGDGAKACSYLTPDAQRQVQLQIGSGVLGSVDCGTLVKQATLVLTPLDKQQLKDLEPTSLQVAGDSASATVASSAAASQGPAMSVQLHLTKVGGDWKISGFANEQGLPGG